MNWEEMATATAAHQGLTLEDVRSQSRLSALVLCRRRIAGALLDAGATYRDCERVLNRSRITVRQMMGDYKSNVRYQRRGRSLADPQNPDAIHGHLCECDGCLNGENPLLRKTHYASALTDNVRPDSVACDKVNS